MQHRTCPTCGTQITSPRSNQRFCDKRCPKTWHNAKSRGTLARLGNHRPGRSFSCAQCGKHCRPGHDGLPAHASKFCCRQCKRRWHSNSAGRRISAEAKLARAARGTKGQGTWHAHTCAECGDSFLSKRGPRDGNTYCSTRCKKKTGRRARRAHRHPRSLSFHKIGERDGWTCALCGDQVDRDQVVPHPLAPTLDHILPLSRGGKHEPSNCQLAHFICNSRKGDGVHNTPVGGQTQLL